VTNTKERSGRKAKYNIPDIGGPDAVEDQSVTKVVQFLVGGGSMALDAGGAETFVPPVVPFGPSADLLGGESATTAPTKKRVSLDHLFSPAAKDLRLEEPAESKVAEAIETPDDKALDLKEEGLGGVAPGESSIDERQMLSDQITGSIAKTVIQSAPDASLNEAKLLDAEASSQTFDRIAGAVDGKSFDDFKEAFGKLLKPNLMTVCRVIYENTMAVGQNEYLTTVNDLASEIGIKKRFCFILLNKLEELGFLERSIKNENKKVMGVLLRLNMNPFK
jgi:DNA-binding MarR family transcriptional regulator